MHKYVYIYIHTYLYLDIFIHIRMTSSCIKEGGEAFTHSADARGDCETPKEHREINKSVNLYIYIHINIY
jgi:hypothetical protein